MLGWAGLGWAGLGCAVLGCAVLGWAGLGWAVLCCAVLGWAVLGCAVLGCAGLCWAGLCCAGLCWAGLCWAVLCCAGLCCVTRLQSNRTCHPCSQSYHAIACCNMLRGVLSAVQSMTQALVGAPSQATLSPRTPGPTRSGMCSTAWGSFAFAYSFSNILIEIAVSAPLFLPLLPFGQLAAAASSACCGRQHCRQCCFAQSWAEQEYSMHSFTHDLEAVEDCVACSCYLEHGLHHLTCCKHVDLMPDVSIQCSLRTALQFPLHSMHEAVRLQ